MFDLLLLLISFFSALAIYRCWEWWVTPKNETSSSEVSAQIVSTTPTINNSDAISNILSDLDSPEVQIILGEALRANMEGYMK